MNVIDLARKAGGHVSSFHSRWVFYASDLEHFAQLVRAAALEEAAGVCETQGRGRRALEHYASLTYAGAAHDCAAAIRQLKETK